MTYQPLHHKYRPQTFTQLVGQEAIATTLSNALRQQRIAPAYLFTGARGTGKTSSARILAKSLNCIAANAPTEEPCGVCETCRAITNGSALDVIEIDAASNTGVDNIRELIERAQFAPVQCRYKVYVLDEVHMLTGQAFNALLKTLEEPPDRVVFILATTDPQRVLPTIISRCQRFDYRRIPLEAMVPHLRLIADKEGIAIAQDAVQLIAQISQGGLRDAESLLDQLSLLAGEVTVERVWDLVGAVPERDLLALIAAIAADHPEAVLDHTRRLMDRGREPLIVLQNLAGFYRDLLIAKTSPSRNDLVAITPPTWAQLCEFSQNLSLTTILKSQQQLRSSETQLKNTTQPRLWLEVTLLGLLPSAIAAHASLEQASARSLPALVAEKPLVQPPPQPAQPQPVEKIAAPAPEIAPVAESKVESNQPGDELEQTWQRILNHIDLPSTQGIVSANCHLIAVNDNEIVVGVRGEHMLKMVQRMLPQIGKASVKTFAGRVKVILQVSEAAVLPTIEPSTPQPSPALPQPLTEPETKSDPVSKPIDSAATPILEPPAPQNIDWEDDDVSKAANSLAYAFNGAVVNLEDDLEVLPADEIATPLPEAATFDLEDAEEDVEF